MGQIKISNFTIVPDIVRKNTKTMAHVQESLQKELESFQKIQKDVQKLVSTRQQLEAQYNENVTVKEELDFLKEDSNVYKLTGPVLFKQDLGEVKLNVQKRIDFIQDQLKRNDEAIRVLQTKQGNQREAMAKLQQQYQGILQKQGMKV